MPLHYLLKAGRRESGLTLREAAACLSVSASTLYRYEEALVEKIPQEKALHILRFYLPYLKQLSDRLEAQAISLDWSRLALVYPKVTAQSLYMYFLATDARGQRTILNLLRYQSHYTEPE